MGIGDWFENHWDDIVVGVSSAAGFALGGPAGAALLGGAAGGITAAVQGDNWVEGAAFGAAGGLLGGVMGMAGKGFLARLGKSSVDGFKGGTQAFKNDGVRQILPGAFDGMKSAFDDSVKRLLFASASAGVGAMPWVTDSALREPYYQEWGYPQVPLINISDEELTEIPGSMPPVMMPDPDRMPYGLEFNPPMQQNYRTLPQTYLGLWDSFGKEPAEAGTLPETLEVSDISGAEASHIPSYTERVKALGEQYDMLRSLSEVVATAVQRTAELCDKGRRDVEASIEELERYAGSHPRDTARIEGYNNDGEKRMIADTEAPVFVVDLAQLGGGGMFGGGPSEDAYAMLLIESASLSIQNILTVFNEAFQALASETATEETENLTANPSAAEEERPSDDQPLHTSGEDPSYIPPGADAPPGAASDQANAGIADPVGAPAPWDLGDSGVSESPSDVGDESGPVPSISSGPAESGRTTLGRTVGDTPYTPVQAAPALGSGMQSAMNSMLLPQLISAWMDRGNAQARQGEEEQKRHVEEAPGGNPVVASRPGSASTSAPAAAAPPTAQAAGQPGPAKSVSAPAETARPPARPAVVAAGGNVVYTFPDGRTQEVSAVVASALDGAFGNAAGTDAQHAYAGTPAAWTDVERIGPRVDPYQVMTGDVGVWEERNALLVVFETESGATLEAVVEGALTPITSLAEMSDTEGEFGSFIGLFHPPGIEKVATRPPAPTEQALAVDQAAAVAVAPA